MFRFIFFIFILIFCESVFPQKNAIDSLAYRVTNGTSENHVIFKEREDNKIQSKDWFRISKLDFDRILIEGNNNVSLATGFNHYLKYVAGIHISWNNLTTSLPDPLPVPDSIIYRETELKNRYYLNYCTFSYTMPFWDEDRWMKEIDWMALHGVNLCLAITGIETVWKNILEKYHYSLKEICDFIPGPAYMAWWQMGNLEGWGGPLPEKWFDRQLKLQRKILARMRSLDINPILPGYYGMIPSNFEEKTGVSIIDAGEWCGFKRPGFISPENPVFDEIADMYYKELTDLYGLSNYYSMDPFHEGGDFKSVDLSKVGEGIFTAMKRFNRDAKWIIQSWHENPRQELLETVAPGEILILDLYSEKTPKWNKGEGYGNHDWLYCMLLNFGGNVGLHGYFNNLIETYFNAKSGKFSTTLTGIGATPEGIENNPVMFELLYELPWCNEKINGQIWLKDYLNARYGRIPNESILKAWDILINTVYNTPIDYKGEGTVESIICARPSWNPKSVSTWGNSTLFYEEDSMAEAKRLMDDVYDDFITDNPNFLYDYIDVSRQSNADRANKLMKKMSAFKNEGRTDSLLTLSEEFLHLILQQDSILNILPETTSDRWINNARKASEDVESSSGLFKENAAMLITVWGDSIASNLKGLHDYSHREWGGITRELYYKRWKAFFEHELRGGRAPDYYQMELDWINEKI